ncbi:MAG: 16S rRNA (cytosine(1402)-N(4))-methyltransferase [Rickettsiales bacterium]|nr:MAG: 16S rRNA (cytosine(1402)-N(4))-methyltransferase [Rickettsiales bacterium]
MNKKTDLQQQATSDSSSKNENISPHCSVLLAEVLEYMQIKDGGHYLDCTFGAGGYTKAMLAQAECCVTGLDQDGNVEKFADQVNEKFGNRFKFVQTNFAEAKAKLGGQKFDGIVLDLGVSSMQIDSAERGFSFMRDGHLDMRMGSAGIDAAEFIESASEEEIANVIYKYGEEVQSRQIAKKIVECRATEPIDTTLKLAQIIRDAMHYRKGKIDPATKSFQAIRIYINKELESLEKFLDQLEDMLVPGGRILVVSFHSLEDSIVKAFFKEYSAPKVARSKYAKTPEIIEDGKWLKVITRKSVTPGREEVLRNPRSRSSRLRVAEKIGGADVT